MAEEPQCRCVWNDIRCPCAATQEDGLCDWCGTRRDADLVGNPNTLVDPLTGAVLGLGGAGEAHTDTTQTPDACWMPNSGREFWLNDCDPEKGRHIGCIHAKRAAMGFDMNEPQPREAGPRRD